MAANKANFTKADLDRALRALEPDDRRRIKKMAVDVGDEMRARGDDTGFRVMFGPFSAMELIARVGIFINKGEKPYQ